MTRREKVNKSTIDLVGISIRRRASCHDWYPQHQQATDGKRCVVKAKQSPTIERPNARNFFILSGVASAALGKTISLATRTEFSSKLPVPSGPFNPPGVG